MLALPLGRSHLFSAKNLTLIRWMSTLLTKANGLDIVQNILLEVG
jgi:hypothetical protein